MTEQERKEKQLKLLKETVQYYKTNPRSIKELKGGHKVCQYITEEKARCAIGRILPKRVCEEIEKKTAKTDASGYSITNLEKKLDLSKLAKVKVQDLFDTYGVNLLVRLQQIHDNGMHWEKTPEGQDLSPLGKNVFKSLRSSINRGKVNVLSETLFD